MEFKMNEYQLPEKISFNFEEMKQELTNKTSMYETMVYTEEQIKDAKNDRASLNKLKNTMNDERKALEKEYMKPFNVFKAQVNEIISIIDKPIQAIDTQIKGYEEKQKQEKLEKIDDYMKQVEANLPEKIRIPFDPKWLNASVSMKSVQTAIDDAADKIKADMDTLVNLPEFSFEAQQVYKSTLDIRQALNEAHRLAEVAKARAEHEAKIKAQEEEQARLREEASKAVIVKAEDRTDEFIPPIDVVQGFEQPEEDDNFIPTLTMPEREWVVVKVKVSAREKALLEHNMKNIGIEYKFI